MKERPILFSGEMVRAILEGRKTQTRRVVKMANNVDVKALHGWHKGTLGVNYGGKPFGVKEGFIPVNAWGGIAAKPFHQHHVMCPHGAPGDRLWVKETFRYVDFMHCDGLASCAVEYKDGKRHFARKFGGEEIMNERTGWRPSIHMPRWASRITLEITDVRVERLQDISEEDALAEGFPDPDGINREYPDRARYWFKNLWDSIYASKHPWSGNPWVWVITFRRVEA